MSPSTSDTAVIRSPNVWEFARELRMLGELPRFIASTRPGASPLDGLPRGDGHTVMVIPGYKVNDLPTTFLRQALTRLGYRAVGWGMGVNPGARKELLAPLGERIAAAAERDGRPVSLIGWSLGGVYAREAARLQPERVRRVFSLGSPFNGEPDANIFSAFRKWQDPSRPLRIDVVAYDAGRPAPPVPCVAIHTKTDGVVAWQCCVEDPAPHVENLEVQGSHGGLVFNFEVLRHLAERLRRS